MYGNDNGIVARLENRHPDEKTEYRDKDAGKESRPKPRYFKAFHYWRNQEHHECIDHQQEESEGENCQRDGEEDYDGPDNCIG